MRIKNAFSYLLYHLGVIQSTVAVKKHLRRWTDRFIILNYHRVNDFNDPFTIDSVTVKDFDNQMRYISKYYTVLSLEQIFARIKDDRSLPQNCLAITFDDGYEDNYTFAYPILKKYLLSATIFLTVNCINERIPLWFDQILSGFKTTSRINFDCPLSNEHFLIETREQKLKIAHATLEKLKLVDNDMKDEYIKDVLTALDDRASNDTPLSNYSNLLTWERVKEMAANNIFFGSHTMTHPILANLTDSNIKYELQTSRKIIENQLGKEAHFFAYPNGKTSDYNEKITLAVKEADYKAALTTVPDVNTPSSDPFAWGRYKPWQNKVEQFSVALLMKGL